MVLKIFNFVIFHGARLKALLVSHYRLNEPCLTAYI